MNSLRRGQRGQQRGARGAAVLGVDVDCLTAHAAPRRLEGHRARAQPVAHRPRRLLVGAREVDLEVGAEAVRRHREAAEPAELLQGGRGDHEQRARRVGEVRPLRRRLARARGGARLLEPQPRQPQQPLEPGSGVARAAARRVAGRRVRDLGLGAGGAEHLRFRLRDAILYYAMLCYAILHYTILCYTIPDHTTLPPPRAASRGGWLAPWPRASAPCAPREGRFRSATGRSAPG